MKPDLMAGGRVVSFVLTTAAAGLVLRVFGGGLGWLPSTAVLALLLAAAHLMAIGSWHERLASLRAALRSHAFGVGLVLLVLLALAVRIPGFDGDLGHVPLDSDLGRVLDGGIEALAGCQWVVVPEPWFGHPTLQRLSLMQEVHAQRSFGGREGLDYDVYAVPDLPFAGACQEHVGAAGRRP